MRSLCATLTIALLVPAQGCSAEPATPPQPMTFAAAREIVDLTKVPPLPGAHRSGASGIQASGSLTLGEGKTFEGVVDHYDGWLQEAGWKAIATNRSDGSVDDIYEKNGLRLNFVAGKSRGFPTGEDVNAGLFLLGNIDPRTLPRPDGVRVRLESPTVVDYKTTIPILDVRKFYSKAMAERGWVEFRDPAPGGIDIPWEIREKEQHFLSGAVTVNVHYLPEPAEGEPTPPLRVLVRAELVPVDPVLPPKVEDLDFDAEPLVLAFAVRQPVEEAAEFYEKALTALGYIGKPVKPSSPELDRALEYSAEGRPTLEVEFLWSKPLTFVGLNEKRAN